MNSKLNQQKQVATISKPQGAQAQSDQFALVGFISGIVGLIGVLLFDPFEPYTIYILGIALSPLSIIAIVFGAIGLKKKRLKGIATAGLVLGIVGTVLRIAVMAFLVLAIILLLSGGFPAQS